LVRAPQKADEHGGVPPFIELVDRIPGFVKAGILALAVVALAMWAAWVRQRRRIERNAFIDPLTGVANGPAFESLLERELERAKRYKRPLAVLFVDVSEDLQGRLLIRHDQTLRDVVAAMREPLREGDIMAHLERSRFAVICPEATEASADTLSRAVERRLEEIRLHAAIGTAERQPTDLAPADLVVRLERAIAMAGPEPSPYRSRRRTHLKAA
jgi:diguanylate cyclase (GGDEF)-like protein